VNQKLGAEVFSFYVSLGDDRSYAAVAKHYGVSKRAVVKAASRENWTARLAEIEREARERADQQLTESLAEVRARHMKMLKVMAGRAIKALSEYPLTSGMEGARVAETVIKLERLVVGEASERTVLSVEQITRREIETLLTLDDDGTAEADDW
jgi:hypothetical protein